MRNDVVDCATCCLLIGPVIGPVYGTLQSWVMRLYCSRDPPGFQHLRDPAQSCGAVSLGARVVAWHAFQTGVGGNGHGDNTKVESQPFTHVKDIKFLERDAVRDDGKDNEATLQQ